MRVALRLVVPVLLATAGAMASTAPATAVADPVATIACLTEAPAAATALVDPAALRDPAALLDPAGAPGVSCLAP
ncbi:MULTISPECIES: hypothetical protein [unclassified Streptomyces]|uniref:hypothetical protein n=1 Tax=unclassified Streptomyces TaxID=2593676 RepID=UPI00093DA9EA|nr:hypothetical protein [Streptomyces sp. CB02400]OKK10010.1 hypothetical protein AMK33_13700 [Streptomyces sp. CB02400]